MTVYPIVLKFPIFYAALVEYLKNAMTAAWNMYKLNVLTNCVKSIISRPVTTM